MNLVAAILLLLLFRGTPAQTLVKAGEITDNPQRLVLSHTESPDQGIARFDCSHCSAMNDLFFVAVTSECGNAGCSFYVFQRIDGKSYKLCYEYFPESRSISVSKDNAPRTQRHTVLSSHERV
jgi:hypothetical protein